MARFEPFDAARYLRDDETILTYLQDLSAQGDPAALASGLAAVVRAKGLNDLAARAGLDPQDLARSLEPGGPLPLETLVKLLSALGMSLSVVPQAGANAAE